MRDHAIADDDPSIIAGVFYAIDDCHSKAFIAGLELEAAFGRLTLAD